MTGVDSGTVPGPEKKTSRYHFSYSGLFREQGYRRYWAASTISSFGNGLTGVALPIIAAVRLDASAAQIGVLSALQWIPSALFAVHAGVVLDRMGRHRMAMVIADAVRFLALATIPLVYVLGHVTIAQLDTVVFAVGTCAAVFTVSDISLFVSLVPADRYVEGQASISGSRELVTMVAPSMAGLLIEVISAPWVVGCDALSFLASALFLGGAKSAQPAVSQEGLRRRAPVGSPFAGLRFVFRDRVMRSTMLTTATVNFFFFMFNSLFVAYMVRALHASSAVVGGVIAVEAAGGFAGVLISKRLTRTIGPGKALSVSCVFYFLPLLILPALNRLDPLMLVVLLAGAFISGASRVVENICVGSIFAAVAPSDIRSRVRGAYQMLSVGAFPFGALAASLVGTFLGLRGDLFIAAAAGTLSFCWLIGSPVLDMAFS